MVRDGMSSWKLNGKLSLGPVPEAVSKRNRLPLAVTTAKEGTAYASQLLVLWLI